MKKLTKKNLDELAMTMNVIHVSEQESYWGMYDNDCFWRCVSYLKGYGRSEESAAYWAYDWYVSEYGYSGINHLSSTNDSAIARPEMRSFLRANSMMVGENDINQIVGLTHTSALEYYRNNPGMESAYHNIILEYKDSDGTCHMYDPQNNKRFTVSANESNNFIPINYGNID